MSALKTAVVRLPLFVLRQAEAAGLDRAELLRAADLSEEALADPDARILVRKNLDLWKFILDSLPDPDLGIRFGSELEIRDAGLVGYTMLHSATLLDALERLFRFGRILEEADPAELRLGSDRAEYGWRAYPQQEVLLQRMIDYELAALVGVVREITGVDIEPLEIRLPHAKRPSDLSAHRRFFRCTISFDQPAVGVVFRRRDLDLPVREADAELGGYLERYAEEVLEALAPGGSLGRPGGAGDVGRDERGPADARRYRLGPGRKPPHAAATSAGRGDLLCRAQRSVPSRHGGGDPPRPPAGDLRGRLSARLLRAQHLLSCLPPLDGHLAPRIPLFSCHLTTGSAGHSRVAADPPFLAISATD